MHNPARLLFYPQNDTKQVKMMYHKARFPLAFIPDGIYTAQKSVFIFQTIFQEL